MGAPAILIERLFSGRECISALKAASGVLLSDKALKARDAGDGTMEVESAQDLVSVKNEVLGRGGGDIQRTVGRHLCYFPSYFDDKSLIV